MELAHLRTLIAAAEEGSLTAAARRRHLTQPAVSLQIKALEEDLGTPVFRRRGRGVTPTRAGEALLARAREALQTLRTARAEVAGIRGLVHGSLHLGVTDAAATGLLPLAFARFHRRYPGVEVRVGVHPTVALAEHLERGEIDLAVGTLPDSTGDLGGIEVRPLLRETLGFVVPKPLERTPLARVLAREPFIAYPGGSTTRALIEGALERAGLAARPIMEIGRPDVMIRLVEAGFGVAVLPREVSREAVARGTVSRPAPRRFRVERRLGLMVVRGWLLEPAARAFAAMLLRGAKAPRPATTPPSSDTPDDHDR